MNEFDKSAKNDGSKQIDRSYGNKWLTTRILLDYLPGLMMCVDQELYEKKITKEEAESCRAALDDLRRSFSGGKP